MNTNKRQCKIKSGFTLIEMMVAISVFLIVITIGLSSLVTLQNSQKKSVTTNQSMYGMHYVFDTISRNLRTGFSYKIITPDSSCLESGSTGVSAGSAISFVDQDNKQIVYKYVKENGIGGIRSSFDGLSENFLTDISTINLDKVCFSVSGNVFGDETQPRVKIFIRGTSVYKQKTEVFNLETSISQRLLDKET